MLVSAPTIESPVTTLYRMAPNAAAAIVPMAYSIVLETYPTVGGQRPGPLHLVGALTAIPLATINSYRQTNLLNQLFIRDRAV
jgi:hypothetical protein